MASLEVEDEIYLGRAFISHSSELWAVQVRSIPSGREYWWLWRDALLRVDPEPSNMDI